MAAIQKTKKKYSAEVRALAKKIVKESAVSDSRRWEDLFPEVSDVIVGERLRKLRKKLKVKQLSVAKAMKCESTAVCNLEKGRFKWCAAILLEYVSAIVELSA